ncbi:MAG: NB-ARC domain-containing protein [Cyanobacteria bacterium P01_A01_bin.45]
MIGQRRGKRGVVLTSEGWGKIQKAIKEWENQENSAKPYTIEILSEITQLDPATISKVLHREVGVDKRTLERFFRAFALDLNQSDYTKLSVTNQAVKTKNKQNKYFCSEAPDVSIFYGRIEELNILQKWIITDYCRLIALVGIGGIGKTTLSTKVVQNLSQNFDFTIWFSLRNAPPPLEIITKLLQILSNGEETDLAKNITLLINKLLGYLQEQRSLLVFDNVDAIFCDSNYAGNYLNGYEGYSELFQKLGETSHQSCLLITSREKPKEITTLEGKELPVRSLQITGLGIDEVKKIFQMKGITDAIDSDWEQLTINYGGNPLYTKFIATTVLDLFDGDISNFSAQSSTVFGDVRNLIAQQFNRLSELEKSLLYWLAINQDAVDLKELQEDLLSSQFDLSQNQPFNLLEVLESLNCRSLIEKKNSKFLLQPVVMEYLTINFIDRICQEIISGDILLFQSHGLLKATAPDYIQDVQKRLIIKPIIERLEMVFGTQHQIETNLIDIINNFREKSPYYTGYVIGNIINLISQLSEKISIQDFSYLNILQANLQGIILNDVDFTKSNFLKTTFTNNFGIIFSLAFSANEEFLVTGSIDGEVSLWKWQENQQVFKNQAHKTIVESVTFSSDSRKIASSSRDRTVKIWDTSTGECILTLNSPNKYTVKNLVFNLDGSRLFGYSSKQILTWDLDTGNSRILIESQSRICSLSLSSQTNILIFGCEDGYVHIWDINTEEFIKQFSTNNGVILSVRIINSHNILACSIKDKIVKIWNLTYCECIETLQSQSYNISLIDISQNGQYLATGSGEKIIKVWDIDTGLYLQSLSGHLSEINAIAFGSIEKRLATASVDRTIKIWDITTGKCVKTLQGRADFVHSVIYSSYNRIIVSGSQHTIKFWDIDTHECISTFFEDKDWLSSVIISPDEKIIACTNIGNDNNVIRIWQIDSLNKNYIGEIDSNQVPHKILEGHNDSIWSIAFNPDSKLIVSGSSDRSVKIWDSQTGQCLKTLYGHNRPVLSVAFSPDGKTIASCGGHSIIKLWNFETGECYQTIQEKASYVIKFNSDSSILASGHTSGIVKLWNTNSGQCIQTLGNFGKPIVSMAFSHDSKLIAYGSFDGTVTVWDINNNKSIAILQEKFSSPWSLAFNTDSNLLIVGRDGEIIQLWDINTGEIVGSFWGDRPLERVNMTGVTGLTSSTTASLKKLGVIRG